MFVLPFNALPLYLLLLLLLLLLLVCAPSSLHGPCTQGYASSYAKYVGATRWPAMWEAEWISLCMPVCECVCVFVCDGVGLDGPLRLTRIHVVGLSVELFAPRSE